MSCKHRYRSVDSVYRDGTVLKQCEKCGHIEEGYPTTLKVVVVVIVILAILFALYKQGYIQIQW